MYKMNGFQKGFLTVVITIAVMLFGGFQVLKYMSGQEEVKKLIEPNAQAEIMEKIYYTPDPKGYYKFDVKTKIDDKINTFGTNQIKQGLIASINAAKWCKRAYTGETYSIWIKSVWFGSNKITGLNVYRYRLQIRTKAMFRQGKLIYSKDLECVINGNDKIFKVKSTEEKGFAGLLLRSLDAAGKSDKAKGTADILFNDPDMFSKFVKELRKEHKSTTLFDRVSSAIVGLHAYSHIKSWINDIETGRIKG